MQKILQKELVEWPDAEIKENFEFSVVADGGTFAFNFRYFFDRWHVWVTLPDEEIREAGVLGGVISWAECPKFGLTFETDSDIITYSGLFYSKLVIITWAGYDNVEQVE